MRGGYKLIDLSGIVNQVATPGGVVIPGVYDAIENNVGKPVIVHGLGEIKEIGLSGDVMVNFVLSGTNFYGTIILDTTATSMNICIITVTDKDVASYKLLIKK